MWECCSLIGQCGTLTHRCGSSTLFFWRHRFPAQLCNNKQHKVTTMREKTLMKLLQPYFLHLTIVHKICLHVNSSYTISSWAIKTAPKGSYSYQVLWYHHVAKQPPTNRLKFVASCIYSALEGHSILLILSTNFSGWYVMILLCWLLRSNHLSTD